MVKYRSITSGMFLINTSSRTDLSNSNSTPTTNSLPISNKSSNSMAASPSKYSLSSELGSNFTMSKDGILLLHRISTKQQLTTSKSITESPKLLP